MGNDIRWDGNMMINKLKKCFYYVKEKVWPTEPLDNDLEPIQDTHVPSSHVTDDPYLAELASIIAQSQDSRILTKEDYQHLRQLREKSKKLEEENNKNGHK